MCSTTSNIIRCISALKDSRLFMEDFYEKEFPGAYFYEKDFSKMELNLRFLQSFVLCGKKLHNNESFITFLVSVEEKLQINVAKLHGSSKATDVSLVAQSFNEIICSLTEEMDKWYVTMLDPHSTFLMISEILEIITLNLEIIVNMPEEVRPLEKQMRFLKSLIPYVTKGNTEARKDLLALAETLAIKIAYVLFWIFYIYYYEQILENWEETLSTTVSTCMQEIKLSDPQVYKIYTQSLSASKLSKQSLDDDDLLAMKSFLDCLKSTLAEIICIDTPRMGLMKGQFQELYERLGSLGIIVKQWSISNFEMDIADVVTDAGIFICSIYQPQIEVSLGHQNLLEKLEIILSKIAEIDPQKPMLTSPRTSSYGFVDCILEKLGELVSSEADLTAKSHFQTIQVELASVRSSLEKDVRMHDDRVEFQTLWDRLLKMAFKVESVIDQKAIDPLSISYTTSLDSIIEYIGNIKVDVLKIEAREVPSRTYIHQPSQTTSTLNEIVGFQDEERAILDRLRGGSHQLRLIAIVGMPGLGKTTLAKKVYDNSSLSYHFSSKAWCTISQVLDKRKVLFDLLKQICPDLSSEMSIMSEHGLADKLRRNLKRKRYFIVLDDIWSTEAWNNLKDSFPDDPEVKGSRIIFTSRSLDAAPSEMLDQELLILSPLNETDSLKLICSKLFPGQRYGLHPALHGLAKQIIKMCGGLPLAIVIVAGVLANAKEQAWEGIMGGFNFLSSGEDNCMYTLEFSYRHLPDYLKPCFLYFGVFPEDEKVSVRRLIRLWIAEGFVRKSEISSLEVVAECYLNMLIGRSLIIVTNRRYDGGAKTCQLHDLLRDFCLEKAKNEHFFHFAKGPDELYSMNKPHNPRRLLIDHEALRESNMYYPHTRSLLLSSSGRVYEGMSYLLQFFKLLKVLDMEQIDLGKVFPSAIQQLVLLAFLAIKGREFSIPSWLANLTKLETLILKFNANELLLPNSLWNMRKLKYLYIQNLQYLDDVGVLPMDNLDDSYVLYELDRFNGAIIDSCNMEKQLRVFPNIHKLNCFLQQKMDGGQYADKFVFPDFLSKLESLHMSSPPMNFVARFEFASLKNLKQLKLSKLRLDWEIFIVIGNQLPSLEVLKLHCLRFNKEEYTWEMKTGEFSKLRILHMTVLPIRRWIACDDHEFVCFQKLVIHYCEDLVELPSCLEMIETLEMIELRDCAKTLENLVTAIEVAQNDWGNSGLKITRESGWY